MTLDYDAFLGCMERRSIMSHLIKSGQDGGKKEREEEGGYAFISIGYWMLSNGNRLFIL